MTAAAATSSISSSGGHDKVAIALPTPRFRPTMMPWYKTGINAGGEASWALEVLYRNAGKTMYVSDLNGDMMRQYASAYAGDGGRGIKQEGKKGWSGGRRRYGRPWRGFDARGAHLYRTFRMLVAKGLAEWPDGGEGGGGGAVGCGGGTGEIEMPDGRIVRRARERAGGAKEGRQCPEKAVAPRITAAGRVARTMLDLGVTGGELIALAMIWGHQQRLGYFVKSAQMLRDNVWMSDNAIKSAFGGLARKGFVAAGRKNGQFAHVRNAKRIEPHGAMLAVIEDMVYRARAGEYVYGGECDDEIVAATAATAAATAKDNDDGHKTNERGAEPGRAGRRAAGAGIEGSAAAGRNGRGG